MVNCNSFILQSMQKKVTIKEVPPYKSILEKSSGDVFIIDNGLEIIQVIHNCLVFKIIYTHTLI